MLLDNISQQQFEGSRPISRVITHGHARRFASFKALDDAESLFLSWCSDSIEPVVLSDVASEVWIGVDQRIACLAGGGSVVFSMALPSSLLWIARFPHVVAVVCDTQIILVNEADYSVRSISGVSDIPEVIEQIGGRLVVTLLDGGRVTID